MVGPWLFSLWQRGKRLSDIEFLSIKDFQGKFIQVTGTRASASGDGEIVSYTPATGKFFYFVGARAETTVASGTSLVRVDLKNDGTERQRHDMGTNLTSHEFSNKYHGDHIDGNSSKKYSADADFTAGTGSKTVQVRIWGFIEDDADSPAT